LIIKPDIADDTFLFESVFVNATIKGEGEGEGVGESEGEGEPILRAETSAQYSEK
jgi:hypothetical protein